MAFEDLRLAAEVFLSQWSVLNVKEEVMMATGSDGTVFISNWDNWLLPPASQGLEPLFQLNGYVLDPEASPALYTIAASGDSVRGRVALVTAAGPDAILLATFRRNLFRQSFWASNVKQAVRDITQRLLYDFVQLVDGDGYPVLDDQNDPWHIVVKQAGKNALVNLQTMLAGFGKTTVENVTIDLSRAHSMIHEVIDDLEGDIDRDVVAWRWKNSPGARRAYSSSAMSALRGPGPFWGLY